MKHEPKVSLDAMRAAFLEKADELWGEHEEKFMKIMEEGETKEIGLTFSANLDFTESAAGLELSIRYSQVVKDKRIVMFDDPNQQPLPFPGTEGEAETAEEPTEPTESNDTITADFGKGPGEEPPDGESEEPPTKKPRKKRHS